MLIVDTKYPSSVTAIHDATESTATDAPIKAGESADFKIVLKTPAKEGRIISYWRLKGPDGTPFGHKLWCDISVRSASVEPEVEPTSYVAPSVKEEPEEEEVVNEKQIGEPVKEEQIEEPIKTEESSTMIFPQLEKESPNSSIHESSKSETAPSTVAESGNAADELFEDLESLALSQDETDDGFMTDEEYDILDASDEEFLDASQKSVA